VVAIIRRLIDETDDDEVLVTAFRSGDEDAFVALVRRHNGLLIRVADRYTPSRAVSEEIAQETWISVLRSISDFEGRSSFRTWLVTILVHCAKRRAAAERRAVPFAGITDNDGHEVDPSCFFPVDHPRWGGMWTTCVSSWSEIPEEHFLAAETMSLIRREIDSLPGVQRAVIMLRDVCGLSADEVCGLLELSEGNQRVLLHRARSAVRRAVEHHVDVAC
jgi:RNA polymerase sigma-70 factor, ECF subfamily